MLDRKSFSDGVQVAWDATSLTLASECLRKYYYRMIFNISPRDKSVHLVFGGIYASSLELFYHRRAEGMSIDEALREAVRHALQESWDQETGQPVVFDSAEKTRSNLIRTIVWYVDEFGLEDDNGIKTHHLDDGRPAVELSFVLEFTDDLLYCGHLDRVVDYGGHLYWMDQKTTKSALSPFYFSTFELSNQFLGYTWAGQVILKSPVVGGIIDAAQIGAGFSRFARQPITFAPQQLEEWRESAIHHMRQAQEATRTGNFPMNLTACGYYGGCPYKILCSRAPSVREHFIAGDFVHPEKPWDPIVPR